MFEKEKALIGITTSEHNLDGWNVNESGVMSREGYKITFSCVNAQYTVTDKDSQTSVYPSLYEAITTVNELLKPYIEFEFNGTRFNLVPLDWKTIEPLMNKVLIVYNKGIELGTLTMECDDVPTGVSISDMSNPILLALKDYLNEWLDD